VCFKASNLYFFGHVYIRFNIYGNVCFKTSNLYYLYNYSYSIFPHKAYELNAITDYRYNVAIQIVFP
jgi:hypothetical protein